MLERTIATVEHGVPLMQPKWDQHHGPTRKASKTWSQDRRWATPSPPEDGQDTPGPREGSGWPPGPTSPWGIAPDKVASWSRGPAGGGTNTDVGARRQKTWASRRRTGPRSWSVGVSAHYLHLFRKDDSDSTWTCMEGKQPRLLHALGKGFFPAKNPSTSFGLP